MASQLLPQQVLVYSIESNNFIDTPGVRINTSSPTPPYIPHTPTPTPAIATTTTTPTTTTTTTTRSSRMEDSESVSVSISISPTSSLPTSSSLSLQQQRQHQHQHQQLSPRQLLKSNNNNKKQPHVGLKPASSPAPFFTSFEVQDNKCTVYVGNIPFDNKNQPCRICCSSCFDNDDNDDENDNDDCEQKEKKEEDDDEKANNDNDNDKQGCCDCEIELKKFLRERIHAAFKVPMKDIGIRAVRFFSVVTNMYDVSIVNNNNNNCDDEDKEDDDDTKEEEEEEDGDANNNTKHHQKLQQHFRLRRHLAACVEFDAQMVAEYALALKNTAFIYDNGNNPSVSSRTTLRMRRWNTNTNTTEPLSPVHSSPKHSSPKHSRSQLLLLPFSAQMPLLPITNNSNSNSMTFNESGRGYNDHDRDNDNDNDNDTPFESAVHCGNLPTGVVTTDDIRLFFFRRMSKAFHGVPPPNIIRIGVRSRRKSNTNNNTTTTNEIIENDAYVEFQDSRVAYRATILKNRRWYVELHRDNDDENEKQQQQQDENNESVDNNNNNSNKESSSNSSDKERNDSSKINNKDNETIASTTTTTQAKHNKKWWKMPMLEIEAWDSNRYEIDDFFLTEDNNANTRNKQEENEHDDRECISENNDDEEGSNSDYDPSSLHQRIDNKEGVEEDDDNHVTTNKNKHTERKGLTMKPTTSSVCTNVVAELRMKGFLICKNEDKIPKLDHFFTTIDGKKESRLCHGYAFRGKVCRSYNSNKFRRSKNNNNNGNNGCGCAYAHINSFEDIQDPLDQMAVLYYVNNNDDVEFVHGGGCTPQEFFLRQQQQQSKKSEKKGADPVTTKEKMMKDKNPQDDKDDQRGIGIRDLEKELEVTCRKLQEEEQLSRNRQEETAVLQNQWRISRESAEEMLQELRSNLSTVRQELVTTQQELEESKRECASLKNETIQQQKQNTPLKNNNKKSALAEISQLEVSKFKNELQQTQAELVLEDSITQESFNKSWPFAKSKFTSFDNFLHASVPTLMEMSYKGTTNWKSKKVEERFSPYESRLDLLRTSTPALAQNELSLSASSLFFENSAPPMVMELQHTVHNEMLDRLRSEFELVGSFYGSEEVAMDGISTVTRCLKLHIGGDCGDERERRYINVDLILTIPNGYPARGVIGVGTRIPDGDSVCEDTHSGAKIELEHYLSSLLSVCRLEAQVCEGKEALLNILSTAENWVKNDDPARIPKNSVHSV
jgi:hypothetical protein